MAEALKNAINHTYLRQGPSYMGCHADGPVGYCPNIGATFQIPATVAWVDILSSGVIWITYQTSVLPSANNILAFTPVDLNGVPVDLSVPPRVPFVWDCGDASAIVGLASPDPYHYNTTIASRFLPDGCR